MSRLVIGTTNSGKVIEIRSALGEVPGVLLEPIPAGVPDIEETGDTFLENAILKAEHYSKFVPDLTLADDSGLSVAALRGRPGVHSARYAENPAARIRRLLGEMKTVPDGKRQAVFYCALALARSGRIVWTTQSEVSGVIARSASGSEGFGYDPVFLLPELNRTMGELSIEDRDRLSARGKALAQLRNFLVLDSSVSPLS
jgi:XTP/dITP diphosphohydrolase